MKANSSVRDCLVAIENLGVFEIHGVENYVSGNQIQAIWLHVIAPFGSIRLQFLLLVGCIWDLISCDLCFAINEGIRIQTF